MGILPFLLKTELEAALNLGPNLLRDPVLVRIMCYLINLEF